MLSLVTAENLNTGATARCLRPDPEAFAHPRLVIGNFARAERQLKPLIREVRRPVLSGLWHAPVRNVEWRIERTLPGGLGDAEVRTLNDLSWPFVDIKISLVAQN